jgi:hypothetical protein
MTSMRVWQGLLAVAIAATLLVGTPSSASAATCDNLPDGWFTINASSAGRNWRVDTPSDPDPGLVRPTGDPRVDPWNQQFILCHPSDHPWGYFRIYANTTGRWLYMNSVNWFHLVYATRPTSDVPETLFYICNYDGNFLLIRNPLRQMWVVHGLNVFGPVITASSWLGGDNLVTTSPRINDRVPWCGQ